MVLHRSEDAAKGRDVSKATRISSSASSGLRIEVLENRLIFSMAYMLQLHWISMSLSHKVPIIRYLYDVLVQVVVVVLLVLV